MVNKLTSGQAQLYTTVINCHGVSRWVLAGTRMDVQLERMLADMIIITL